MPEPKPKKKSRETIRITADNKIEIMRDGKVVDVPTRTRRQRKSYALVGLFIFFAGLIGIIYSGMTWNQPTCGTLWALGIGIGLVVISLRFLIPRRKKG